jgi:hypothetical protein
VFFWAVIELATAVFSACLPTYRPIWLFIRGRPVNANRSNNASAYAHNYGYSSKASRGYQSDALAGDTDKDDVALTDMAAFDTQIRANDHYTFFDDAPDSHGIRIQQTIDQQSRRA